LVIDSVNVVAEQFAVYVYLQVHNGGASVICYPQITTLVENALGDQIVSLYGFFDAPAYQIPDSAIPAPCLGAGETGANMGIELFDGFQISDIARVHFGFDAAHFPGAIPHPARPQVATAVPSAGVAVGVTGQLVGQGAGVDNIQIDVYPRNASGLIVGHLQDFPAGALAPNDVVTFTTDGTTTAFTDFLLYVDFLPY
jgi:hypothetical protein